MEYAYIGIGLFLAGAVYKAVSSALLYGEYKSRLRNAVQTAEYRRRRAIQRNIGFGIMTTGVLAIVVLSVFGR